MTPDQLSALAGILLSLALAYVPGLAEWYAGLEGRAKRLVMVGLLLTAAGGALAYQCRSIAACYTAGWEQLLSAFIAALVANQATYLLAVPRSETVLVLGELDESDADAAADQD